MTEQEAIKELTEAVITALEEIQQYRAMQSDVIKNNAELMEYRTIGTVEECREAVEKQRAKLPLAIVKSNIENGGMYGDCPRCGEHMESLWTAEKFCPKCGQHIDWSGNNYGIQQLRSPTLTAAAGESTRGFG